MTKTLKLKPTKTLADILQKNNTKCTIYKADITEQTYALKVDFDTYNHEEDFNYNTGKFNVIVVEYPSNYYACNTYITTKDLQKIYNKCTEKSLDCFIKNFNEYIQI